MLGLVKNKECEWVQIFNRPSRDSDHRDCGISEVSPTRESLSKETKKKNLERLGGSLKLGGRRSVPDHGTRGG